jgi:hypothetical protein
MLLKFIFKNEDQKNDQDQAEQDQPALGVIDLVHLEVLYIGPHQKSDKCNGEQKGKNPVSGCYVVHEVIDSGANLRLYLLPFPNENHCEKSYEESIEACREIP